MINQDVMTYVDRVIRKADIPDEYKIKLENELFRNILLASDNPRLDTVMKLLSSPDKLAEEITKKCEISAAPGTDVARHGPPEHCPPTPPPPPPYYHPRYGGEYMREHSNVNLKLLYIPLLQISSGTERLTLPLTEGC